MDDVTGAASCSHGPGKAAGTGRICGPDGSLYIADSVRGTIWRVVFRGQGP